MIGRNYGIEDFLHRQSVVGLLILKNGQIAYEYYGSGNTAGAHFGAQPTVGNWQFQSFTIGR